jgi:hypothetical protein
MIASFSVFWPIEDVGKSGYCYGWVNERLVCVAGVLRVDSLGERPPLAIPRPSNDGRENGERAKALLDDFLRENPQFIEVSSTNSPVILGECSSNHPPRIQLLPEVGPGSSRYVSIRSCLLFEADLNQNPTLCPCDVPQVCARFRPLPYYS